MINHHPTKELLTAHIAGELPASMSAAISMHAELCSACQSELNSLTDKTAHAAFAIESSSHNSATNNTHASEYENNTAAHSSYEFDALIAAITSDETQDVMLAYQDVKISVKGESYRLPRAIHTMELGKWSSLGKISRSRLPFNEGQYHASLLKIDAGGAVPKHTHKGFEVTVLLDGSFQDELGEYHEGDFIMLDSEHEHAPITDNGCLCYTVSNDAIQFTQGLNKLLNPIGGFIY